MLINTRDFKELLLVKRLTGARVTGRRSFLFISGSCICFVLFCFGSSCVKRAPRTDCLPGPRAPLSAPRYFVLSWRSQPDLLNSNPGAYLVSFDCLHYQLFGDVYHQQVISLVSRYHMSPTGSKPRQRTTTSSELNFWNLESNIVQDIAVSIDWRAYYCTSRWPKENKSSTGFIERAL